MWFFCVIITVEYDLEDLMKGNVNNVRLVYGDAMFQFYQINLNNPPENSQPIFHDHKYYEIHMATEGSHAYSIDNRQFSLFQNQMLIIPPQIYHSSVPKDPGNYKFSALSFSLCKTEGEEGYYDFFRNSLESYALTPINVPQKFIKRTDELSRRELYGTVKGECYLKMQASAIIYELFDILNQFGNTDSLKRIPKSDDNLVLLDALLCNPQKRLKDIADEISYSPRHTARLIKSIYGCSITELRKKQSTVTKED